MRPCFYIQNILKVCALVIRSRAFECLLRLECHRLDGDTDLLLDLQAGSLIREKSHFRATDFIAISAYSTLELPYRLVGHKAWSNTFTSRSTPFAVGDRTARTFCHHQLLGKILLCWYCESGMWYKLQAANRVRNDTWILHSFYRSEWMTSVWRHHEHDTPREKTGESAFLLFIHEHEFLRDRRNLTSFKCSGYVPLLMISIQVYIDTI